MKQTLKHVYSELYFKALPKKSLHINQWNSFVDNILKLTKPRKIYLSKDCLEGVKCVKMMERVLYN